METPRPRGEGRAGRQGQRPVLGTRPALAPPEAGRKALDRRLSTSPRVAADISGRKHHPWSTTVAVDAERSPRAPVLGRPNGHRRTNRGGGHDMDAIRAVSAIGLLAINVCAFALFATSDADGARHLQPSSMGWQPGAVTRWNNEFDLQSPRAPEQADNDRIEAPRG